MRRLIFTCAVALAAPVAARPAGPPVVAAPGHRWRPARELAEQRLDPWPWRTLRDRDGAIAWMWGSAIPAPGAVADGAVALRAARAFVAGHRAELAPGAELEVVADQLDGPVRTVGFRQTWHGLRVVGGQLGVMFERDRLFAVSSQAIGDLSVAPSRPRAREAVLRTRAEAWLLADTGLPAATRAIGERVVLPLAGEAVIAYALDVEGAADRWTVYVAEDGEPLARESRRRFASATLAYNTGVRYPLDERIDRPAPDAAIEVDGMAQTTGDDGSLSWPGTANATVVPSLVGPYVAVTNEQGALATASFVVAPGQTVAWNVATDELADAQLSTFVFGNLAKARARLINPSVIPWIDQPLDFFVNEAAGMCNAYSTGDDVHFYRGTPQVCENTGRLSDIVFHEFGHSLHNHSVIAGVGAFESSLSEGLADYNAANLVEDSGVGRGLDFTDAPQRDIDPPGRERAWPEDISADPHITGLIVSGALWDLRKALIAELGHDAGVALAEHVFAGVMQRAADIPSSYLAALVADDDDGDLGNGTPHFCEIVRAFGPHGLAGSDYQPVELGVHTVNGLAISLPVASHTGATCPAPQLTSISVTWQVGDAAPSTFALAPAGDVWTGAFPAQPDGTSIQYTIAAAFDDGSTRVLPDNPADPRYEWLTGTLAPIWCERMDADPHWMQSGNLAGEWQFGRPIAGTGDPSAAHSGTAVLGNNVLDGGLYMANETTSIVTPAIDVSAFHHVHLQYWRWLAVDDAMRDQAAIEIDGVAAWANATAGGKLPHIDKEWRLHDLEVTPHVGDDGLADVRWKLHTNATIELAGWNLDDVCLIDVVTPPAPVDGDPLIAGGGGCGIAESGGGSPLIVLALLALSDRRRTTRCGRRCSRPSASRRDR